MKTVVRNWMISALWIGVLSHLVFSQARLPANTSGGPGQTPYTLRIRVEEQHVIAEIRAVPLHVVLEELAARTGIIFQVSVQFNPNVSVVLYKEPLGDAIRRIITPHDSASYYRENLAGEPALCYVRIFPRGMKGQNLSLRYIGTGKITRSGEELIETPEQALEALATGKSLEIRQKAVEFLAASKGDIAVQALTQAMGDPAPEVRVAAIEGLTGLTARSALPQIVAALKDEHPSVRQSAVGAIMIMGDAQNVKDLRPLAKDNDAGVATAVELAIRRLSDRRP